MAKDGADVSMLKPFAAISMGGESAQQEITYNKRPDKERCLHEVGKYFTMCF